MPKYYGAFTPIRPGVILVFHRYAALMPYYLKLHGKNGNTSPFKNYNNLIQRFNGC
uniref:Uncharacterized protein n=1 Tax=Rhizophagus irregularis (strain DAOM 181602 / DAOM 197198 / MUCL 43194) TaxID=747089 RepID=U9TRD3_RHIID